MHLLLDHPIWFDRIYHELKTELDGPPETVSSATLSRLPILNAVINEASRIRPAAQQDLPRNVPPEGAVLAGKFIPGSTIVTLQMYAVHTDPNLWEEPDKFMPERWLKENPTDALNEIMPFSRGVRVCLGRNLAKAELRMTLSMMVYYFKFQRVGNDDMTPVTLATSKPRCGRLIVKVTERATFSM
jgi:cytochrome P450